MGAADDQYTCIPVRKFKSMAVALKTLELYVKDDAEHLQTGKPFQNFGHMRL